MLGRLLAGTTETPGEIIDYDNLNRLTRNYLSINSGKWKRFAGMASEEGRKFNGWFTEEDASFIPEGESADVPFQGPVKKVIDNLVGGLRVGMSYAGAHNLADLRENAEWAQVTANGHTEGKPRNE
jgi:IMP dehydrogenase